MGEPSYLRLYREGLLQKRALQAEAMLRDCRLCPRACRVDRLAGALGVCRTGRRARVASAHAHFGEEAPLVGTGGSGTIFFSFCNLLCSFCQNDDISHGRRGDEVEPDRLAAMMMRLQDQGCHNINFVTPTHVAPQILQGLVVAVAAGLRIPLVYNCGGYESVETLKGMEGVWDIYMPDFKFWDERWGKRFCGVSDYREQAAAALREMHRQVGDLELDPAGVAVRGLLVRHLVMPGGLAGSGEVLRFLAREISPATYVNVMAQYRPCGKALQDPLINRRIGATEYELARECAREVGLYRLDR